MSTISAVIGFISLVGGYQLYWLFIGGIAFILGGYVGDTYNLVNGEWELILFSLIISGVSILLSLYFRKIMHGLAYFFIGGYIVYFLPQSLAWNNDWFSWQIFILSGLFSSMAALLWKSWGTIIFSTIGGATIVIENLSFGGIDDLSIFIVLLVIGLTAQFLLWHYGKPDEV